MTIGSEKPLKMPHREFALTLAMMYGKTLLVVLALLVLAGFVLGALVDLRWLILGLMVALIVAPMLLVFFYLRYGMNDECSFNVLHHTLEVTPDSLRVVILKEPEKEDEPYLPQREAVFPLSMLGMASLSSDSVTVPITDKRKGFVWVPYSSFTTRDGLKDFLSSIQNSSHK